MTEKFSIFHFPFSIFDYKLFLLIIIFIAHIFLRFYDLEGKSPFGWDQLDNAWVAKNIIVDHKFPISGMQAKLNSGINIGPLYYYLISVFYYFTNLDPIASPIFAGVTSIFCFFTLFYITKKLFSFNVAIIAVFLNTVSFYSTIYVDRVQWPVDFTCYFDYYLLLLVQSCNWLSKVSSFFISSFRVYVSYTFYSYFFSYYNYFITPIFSKN